MSREELEAEAASPKTTPTRLQELANNYPKLRPLIAMNPATYPALVKWLADLNDPAINVALAQRTAATSSSPGGPRRVSVMGRSDEASLPTAAASARPFASEPMQTAEPVAEPSQPSTQTGELGIAQQAANPNRTPLIIVGVLLAVIAVTLMALLFGGGNQSDPADGAGQSDSTAAASPEDQGDAPDSQDEAVDNSQDSAAEDADETIAYPAPDTALVSDHFVSPSGNIACRLGSEGVTCTINAHAFADPALPSCGAGPTSLTATRATADLDCSAAQVSGSGATSLAYGDYATYETFACRSTESGIACWNMVSGVGFGIARDGYQISLTGPIDPNNFPWN